MQILYIPVYTIHSDVDHAYTMVSGNTQNRFRRRPHIYAIALYALRQNDVPNGSLNVHLVTVFKQLFNMVNVIWSLGENRSFIDAVDYSTAIELAESIVKLG